MKVLISFLSMECTEFLLEVAGRAVPFPGEALNGGAARALALSQDW